MGKARPHHRHVAGVVGDAILLLVGGVVLLIHDGEAEIREGKEQGGARARHHLHLAARHALQHAGAAPRGDAGMPFRRPNAETAGEAVEEGLRQRDFGQQDQRLPPLPQGFGHRFEIDFRLAGAGDAVQQVDAEGAGRHRRAQHGRRLRLRRGEAGNRKGRVRKLSGGLGRQHHRFQHAVIDQPVHYGGGHARLPRRIRLAAHESIRKARQQLFPRGSGAGGRAAGGAHTNPLARGAGAFAMAQRHAQHHATRSQRIVGHPVDELEEVGGKRHIGELRLHRLELRPVHRGGGGTARPDAAHHAAIAQRHMDKVARRQVQPLGDGVGIGRVQPEREQDIHGARAHVLLLVQRRAKVKGVSRPGTGRDAWQEAAG